MRNNYYARKRSEKVDLYNLIVKKEGNYQLADIITSELK